MAIFNPSSHGSFYLAGPIPTYLSTNFTFGGWIYCPAGGASQIFNLGGSNGWGLRRLADGKIYCHVQIGGTIYSAAGVTYTANTWFHLMVTRSGTTWRVYINGVFVATGTTPSIVPNNTYVYFRNPLNSAIAEWMIAERVLSDDEIAMLGSGFSPKCLSLKPKVYWPMYGQRLTSGVPDISNKFSLIYGFLSSVQAYPHPRIVHPGSGGGGFNNPVPISLSQDFTFAVKNLNKPAQVFQDVIENKKTVSKDINALRANASTPLPPFRASRISGRFLINNSATFVDENYVQWFFESQIVPVAAPQTFDIEYTSLISPASLPMLVDYRLSIGTKDFAQNIEILSTPDFNEPFNIESLCIVLQDSIDTESIYEELISSIDVYNVEYLSESDGGLLIDYLFDIENLGSVAKDEEFNLDYLFSSVNTDTFAIDNLLSVSGGRVFDLDSLGQISNAEVLNIDNLTSLDIDKVFDVENICSVSYAREMNIEFLSGTITITSDHVFDISYSVLINSISDMDISYLHSLVDDNILDVEYVGSLLASQFVFDIEHLAGVAKNIQNIEEVLGAIDNPAIFDIEARGNISKSFIFDLDHALNIALTYNLNIETLFGVSSNSEYALSYLKTVQTADNLVIDLEILEELIPQYWRLRARGTQWVLRRRPVIWTAR